MRPELCVPRRRVLQRSLGLAALLFAPQADGRAESRKTPRRRARAVIVLLQEGGLSHLDSWDPKPHAPAEIRGSFGTIATSNPALIVGEHTPLLARQAHLYNVVRSVYMDNERRDHSPGLHWVLTGHDNQAAGVDLVKVNTQASVGSVVAHSLGAVTSRGLPNFVAVPNRTQLGGRVRFTQALYLGATCEAFDAGEIPGSGHATYTLPSGLLLPAEIPLARLSDRRQLLRDFDQLRRDRQRLAATDSLGVYQDRALELLLGAHGRQAFDLNAEPRAIREHYGHSPEGQGALLARRLVEAGVSYVLVNCSRDNSWDTHGDNFNRLRNTLLPPMDRAAAALLTDLDERGLLDEVLVLMTGEMGRTPLINASSGRDHWPDVFSLLIAGGGLTRGQVLGRSSRHADTPAERPVHFQEILATVYQQLDIDHRLSLLDDQDRPTRILPDAAPVTELI